MSESTQTDKAMEAAADEIVPHLRFGIEEHAKVVARKAISAYLKALQEDEEMVTNVATIIANAMFADGSGDKSPTVAGYRRAARAAISTLIKRAKESGT